ncbi:MAG: carboxypeptidase regulatory-like domain-containing protein [Ignavibacteriae bacterium]|nr:MAG: carboxypeptidase regulatory-like domain-containing protein [Ignavibacteriota bacterium]
MKHKYQILLFGILMVCILTAYMGCGKDETTVGPTTNSDPNAPTYPVTVTVLNPSGSPQGGVTVTLQNPPKVSTIFTALTDSLGRATIQSPSGVQIIIATMGTVFQVTVTVNVNATSTPTVVSTPIRLTQVTTATQKVLVVSASAEELENVLRTIGYTKFDSTDIYTMVNRANTDSIGLLTYLKQYSLIFSDCDGGSEYSSSYEALSRTYGRYVAQGGKMYGGHYNYYHLGRIWPGYYSDSNRDGQYENFGDSLQVVDQTLKTALGYSLASWSSSIDSRRLSGYEKWSAYPSSSKIYAVIYRTTPSIGVIVENHIGTGKYLWTDYHNQDIKDDPKLVKIVQYFLLSM